MTEFVLDARLAADTLAVARWPLCRLLLMNDAHYPWFILVPARAGLREIYELDAGAAAQLLEESIALARAMMAAFKGDKLNVAALGNVVSQLHVHHVVRRVGDAAWPAPVWGRVAAEPYTGENARATIAALLDRLPEGFPAG